MPHAELVAERLARTLESAGAPCVRDGTKVSIPAWDLHIHAVEGDERRRPDGAIIIMPAVVSAHTAFPKGFARELGVGIGESLDQAAAAVVANWTMLFFPLLKFLFTPNPHDCLVHQQPVTLPADGAAPYTLLCGPVWLTGFQTAASPKDLSQSALWDTLSGPLLTRLGPGVSHIRCYVARMSDGLNADVFVNGEAWPEGGALLRRLAESFPAPTPDQPVHAYKQHLFLRPQDLAAGARAAMARQLAQWAAAIGPAGGDLAPYVLRGLYVCSRLGSEESKTFELIGDGVPADTASRLVSFLPSAAARLALGDKVQFDDTYFWHNSRTGLAQQRRYDQTPIFVAALDVFDALTAAGTGRGEMIAVAETSAEWNGVAQAARAGRDLKGARFTEMVHDTGEEVDGRPRAELQSAARARRAAAKAPAAPASAAPPAVPATRPLAAGKPWWRFW